MPKEANRQYELDANASPPSPLPIISQPAGQCYELQQQPNAPAPFSGQQPPVNNYIIVPQQQAIMPPGSGLGRTGIPLSQYQVDLFNCCHNCFNCMTMFCCPCYVEEKITRRLNENCCYPDIFGMLPLSVRFRTLAGITDPTMCEEGCTFVFCHWCATLRLLNEMEERQFRMTRS